MCSQVYGNQVSYTLPVEKLCEKTSALWDELCLWGNRSVWHKRFVAKYDHPDWFSRETYAWYSSICQGWPAIIIGSSHSLRQWLWSFLYHRWHCSGKSHTMYIFTMFLQQYSLFRLPCSFCNLLWISFHY